MKFSDAYFRAEQAESIIFLIAGLIAIAISLYSFFILKKPFYYGLGISLSLIALIQITVGTTIFIRSPKDLKRMEIILQQESSRIQSEEIPRMKTVQKNFKIYRYVEMALIAAGIILMFGFSHNFWNGIGTGLFIQASIMLVLDFFAERRGAVYLDELNRLI